MLGEKAEIRRKVREQIAFRRQGDLTSERAQTFAQALCEQVKRDPHFQKAKAISLFAALPDEISTFPIHQVCCQEGKKVYYPWFEIQNQRLEFFPVLDPLDPRQMQKGPFGIVQPIPPHGDTCPVSDPPIDLFIVPGIAFTVSGSRLGRGNGFYDRTLGQPVFQNVLRYGLAYSFQILEALPMEAFDLSVHKVFTPDHVYEPDPVSR